MHKFNVTILGCSSAIPTTDRNPTAQLVNHNDHLFLLDCGEGTQVSLRKMHVHFQKINHIFISHLHGDHFFGLIGLVSSMHLLGRSKALHIYGPPELEQILQIQLDVSLTVLSYSLIFHPTRSDIPDLLFENEVLQVRSFPMLHRIPTTGFIFEEKASERRMNKEMIEIYQIPPHEIPLIRRGADFMDSKGNLIPNHQLTMDPYIPRKYAFCSDTAYFEEIIDTVKGADLLYHETTFMQNRAQNAADKFHSTTFEAARIAVKAEVKRLLIGHYSARYDDLQPLLEEARTVFPETVLASEGLVLEV